MGRLSEALGIFKDLKDLLPVIKELVECFRELNPSEQARLLAVVDKRDGRETAQSLAMILNVPQQTQTLAFTNE